MTALIVILFVMLMFVSTFYMGWLQHQIKCNRALMELWREWYDRMEEFDDSTSVRILNMVVKHTRNIE